MREREDSHHGVLPALAPKASLHDAARAALLDTAARSGGHHASPVLPCEDACPALAVRQGLQRARRVGGQQLAPVASRASPCPVLVSSVLRTRAFTDTVEELMARGHIDEGASCTRAARAQIRLAAAYSRVPDGGAAGVFAGKARFGSDSAARLSVIEDPEAVELTDAGIGAAVAAHVAHTTAMARKALHAAAEREDASALERAPLVSSTAPHGAAGAAGGDRATGGAARGGAGGGGGCIAGVGASQLSTELLALQQIMRSARSFREESVCAAVETLRHSLALDEEVPIMALIILERCAQRSSSRTFLSAANWQNALVCAVLLAQKTWSDGPLRRSDVHSALGSLCDLRSVSALEQEMCALLRFELAIKPRTFFEYYFALRELGDARLRARGKRKGVLRRPLGTK